MERNKSCIGYSFIYIKTAATTTTTKNHLWSQEEVRQKSHNAGWCWNIGPYYKMAASYRGDGLEFYSFEWFPQFVRVIAWFVVIFGINTTSDVSKLLYVISWAVRRMKFETILKYHEWYLCQISRTNHAIICLYYYPQRFEIFTCRYFKLSWNSTALSQSNCRNFSCSSIK